MKTRKLAMISTAIMSLTLSAGIAVGLHANQKAQAADTSTSRTLYLDPTATIGTNFHWLDADAKFAVYWFGTGDGVFGWSDFMVSADEETGYLHCYKTTVDLSKATTIIFVRFASTKAATGGESAWNDKWNQSDDIALTTLGENDIWRPTTDIGDSKYSGTFSKMAGLARKVRVDLAGYSTTETLSEVHVHVWGAPGDVFSLWPGLAMTKVKDQLYEASVNTSYAKLIFNWKGGEMARQSITLDYPQFIKVAPDIEGYDGVVGYHMSASQDSGAYYGNWGCLVAPTLSQGIYRLWLDRQNVLTASGNVYVLHYWEDKEGGFDREIIATGYHNVGVDEANARWLVYFDVPSEILNTTKANKFQFKVYGDKTGNFVAATNNDSAVVEGRPAGTYADGDNARLYYMNQSGGTYHYTLGNAGSAASSILSSALVKVYEAYYTCSPDKNNGHGAYDVFINTWLHSGACDAVSGDDVTWWVSGNLDAVDHSDYASGDTGYAGDRSATYKLQAKHDEMLRQFKLHASVGSNIKTLSDETFTWPVVVVISVTFLVFVSFAGFYFIRKRRGVSV